MRRELLIQLLSVPVPTLQWFRPHTRSTTQPGAIRHEPRPPEVAQAERLYQTSSHERLCLTRISSRVEHPPHGRSAVRPHAVRRQPLPSEAAQAERFHVRRRATPISNLALATRVCGTQGLWATPLVVQVMPLDTR